MSFSGEKLNFGVIGEERRRMRGKQKVLKIKDLKTKHFLTFSRRRKNLYRIFLNFIFTKRIYRDGPP